VESLTDHVSLIRTVNNESSVKAMLIRKGQEVVLADAMYGKFAEGIAAYLAENNLRLKKVINTHYHGDHTQGNTQFENVSVIAHENTYQHIADSAEYGPTAPFEIEDLPNVLFDKNLILYLGDLRIEVVFYGTAHTRGDAIVFVPQENVVHVGDIILAPGALPFTSDPEALVAVLERIVDRIDDKTRVVTGHGEVAGKSDVVKLIEVVNATVAHVKSGKGSSQYPSAWDQWDSEFITMKMWLGMLGRIYR
jgi:glyoxylase-like metal-dependent hydrolase (beta-lactamase superfamily II)